MRRGRFPTPAFWLLMMIGPALAGCLTAEDDPGSVQSLGDFTLVHVVDEDATPVGYAGISAYAADDLLGLFNANETGVFSIDSIPAGATELRVTAPGHVAQWVDVADLGPVVVLAKRAVVDAAAPVEGLLQFLSPVELLCPLGPEEEAKDAAFGRGCGGFGENQVEVAADGTIWASSVCCIGRSPPIWTSRDGGQSFQLLNGEGTGVVRDAFGIEGDFAIDDAGNVFFFDISAATAWFTAYEADGTHRHTVPIAFPPLVDRPWVRAGAEDEVFLLYNTGSATNLFTSYDGGLTWDYDSFQSFPCALGTFGQGATRNVLAVAACTSNPRFWLSTDGGRSFGEPEPVPMPEGNLTGGHGIDNYLTPVGDEAGNIYVPFTHNIPETDGLRGLYVARRAPDGQWAGPWLVSPSGSVPKFWPAAGAAGHVGIAYYHTPSNASMIASGDAVWHLMTAVSIDADGQEPSWQNSVADPEPVLLGQFGRRLGDFLQADLTPDGRLVIVYSRNVEGFENLFVQSDGGLDLSQGWFLNDPATRTA